MNYKDIIADKLKEDDRKSDWEKLNSLFVETVRADL